MRSKCLMLCVLACCVLFVVLPVTASTIYVKPNGDDTADGLSWAHAKKTVSGALAAAQPMRIEGEAPALRLPGDMVWVAAGTYTGCITTKPGVEMYGGFAGAETALEERNFSVNRSIIDGQGGGSVVTVPSGAGPETVVNGFTIRGGSAVSGGGILCDSASPRIVNNIITSNHATSGGGISCNNGSPIIAGNIIVDNTSSSGAGISCSSSSSQISNNVIVGNTATDAGGGLSGSVASILFVNNIVAFNSSGISLQGGQPSIHNNCVYGNTDAGYTGVSAGQGDISTDPLFVDRQHGDYHLSGTSPCIGSGDNSSIEPQSMDMDYSPRLYGESVDIGAYEPRAIQ